MHRVARKAAAGDAQLLDGVVQEHVPVEAVVVPNLCDRRRGGADEGARASVWGSAQLPFCHRGSGSWMRNDTVAEAGA